MATVVWSGPALTHVRRIGRIIEDRRPRTAAKWVRRIMAAPDILATMPSFGAVVEEFGVDHIREFGVGPYRVTYAVEGDVCTIAAVIHARQDLTNTLDANDFQP